MYVNQSLSSIRRCRTDLASIVFPVFFARFLSHLLCFKLSFLEGFRSSFINSVFSFFCCNSSESRSKSRILQALDIYLDSSRLRIFPPLFTSPSGDSCIILLMNSFKIRIVE